jgi:hypothetical protein
LETLTKLLDNGHSVDVLYLVNTFDKVQLARLMAKCGGLGLGGRLLDWIENLLSDRKQSIILNGCFSSWADVVAVIGPTLFIIFINDIDLAMEVAGSFILKFSNDTKVGMVLESEELTCS